MASEGPWTTVAGALALVGAAVAVAAYVWDLRAKVEALETQVKEIRTANVASARGPAGPQGPQGERGPAGPQGLPGPTTTVTPTSTSTELSALARRVTTLESQGDNAQLAAKQPASTAPWKVGACLPHDKNEIFKTSIVFNAGRDALDFCWRDGAKFGTIKKQNYGDQLDLRYPSGNGVAAGSGNCRFSERCVLEYEEFKFSVVPEKLVVDGGQSLVRLNLENQPR